VIHRATPAFWEAYHSLHPAIREVADRSFALLKKDPRHPSLHLKKVSRFWSARVGLRHRALAVEIPGGLLWFWVGDHAVYDRLTQGE
jgi:hypothetical protein